MAGTAFTRKLYEDMISTFRDFPGNASHCARELGIDRRMAARAWSKGFQRYDWARPIKELFAAERQVAQAHVQELRAQVVDHAQEERDRARAAAQVVVNEEERLMDVARKDVLATLVIAAELTPAMRTLAKLVSEVLTSGALSQKDLGPKYALALIREHSVIIGKATQAADALVKLGRLGRGQPNAIVQMDAEQNADLTYEEAVAELESAGDLLVTMRKAGALPADLATVLDSGDGTRQLTHAPDSDDQDEDDGDQDSA